MNVFQLIFNAVFGTKQQRDIKKIKPFLKQVNEFEPKIKDLANDQLSMKTKDFRKRLEEGCDLEDIFAEAFAVVRETSVRTLKMRHFDVQIIGGHVLNNNAIAEMKTGEGKTLVATLALYVNALEGKGAHLITVNDYLAKRDALWMGPIFKFLGMSIGIINHDKAYRIEWDDISDYSVRPVECTRREAYHCDITYGTNNEFGFDYLRDNMVFRKEQKVQRDLNFAIVDEVDSILIDEARTPLIISGPSDEATDLYYKIDKIIPRLTRAELNEKNEPVEGSGDYALDEKDKNAVMTEQGSRKVEELLNIEDLYSPKNSHIVHHVLQAIRAHYLFERDVAYVVENGEVVIVDEFTGRKMAGRRWSDGLHQAIEAKEKVSIRKEFQTLATITFQNYFKMYNKLAGMTGTAETEAEELYTIYKLDVVVIPTNLPIARLDHADKIYINENAKFKAIVKDVSERHNAGQPMLIGTVSVEKSEKLSKYLKQKRIPHNILNAKYHAKEADIIANAGFKGSVTIATNMAGRGTDIKLGEGVKEIGGLHVIGSERHEARRIDNQLRGRSGRQGDAGSSQFYVSLEDDLMRLFGMDNRMKMMTNFGFTEEEEIQSKMISKAIEKAQKRVENRNFEIRKNLLEFDDVMNEHRSYIYEIRDRILTIEENFDLIDELIGEAVNSFISGFEKPRQPMDWDKDNISKWFYYHFKIDPDFDFDKTKYEQGYQQIFDEVKKQVWNRFESIPDQIKGEAFRFVALQVLDNRWKEHLRNIDMLKDGINLMGYAQKNPIVEYKLRSYDLFDELRSTYIIEILSMMSKIQIDAKTAIEETEQQQAPTKNLQTVHNELGQFDAMSQKGSGAGKKSEPIRKAKKPGRNDPCWCGSGKKYKFCHMESDMSKERNQ